MTLTQHGCITDLPSESPRVFWGGVLRSEEMSGSKTGETPARKFHPGDVVQLKSGGTKMTVSGYGSVPGALDAAMRAKVGDPNADLVRCKWVGKKAHVGYFEEATLRVVSAD